MPVEIREMVVRAVVGEPQENAQPYEEPGKKELDRAALVEECVRQVLKALKKSRER